MNTEASRAPGWLIVLTLALALIILFMAVAETTLWTHFLVDTGERLALLGLGFIFIVGIFLHRRGRLIGSLALALPWILYPVLTQGDQIIDNLTINQMRVVTQSLLALIFLTPIVLLVFTARRCLAPVAGKTTRRRFWTPIFPGLRQIEQGRIREGTHLIVATLLLLELWLAYEYLGKLMVLTLVGSGLAMLYWISLRESGSVLSRLSPARGRRLALALFVVGCMGSLALYLGFKNRPGAYQGSPHHFHDPAQQDALYPLSALEVGRDRTPLQPDQKQGIRLVLELYGGVLQDLTKAYYVLDRNYNYAFHNELFLRHTPLLPDFRRQSLERIDVVRREATRANARSAEIEAALPSDHVMHAFLREIRQFVDYNLRRSDTLAEMSGRFEQTKAGLQHATHLYEGEGKFLGVTLMSVIDKHEAVRDSPESGNPAGPFLRVSGEVHDAYANRIVGF